jgi:hypothetical protein
LPMSQNYADPPEAHSHQMGKGLLRDTAGKMDLHQGHLKSSHTTEIAPSDVRESQSGTRSAIRQLDKDNTRK